jgi:RNA polymerase sigma-70 factor (ECF subfamily)
MRADDDALLDQLRQGNERAFAQVVVDWSPAMLRVARGHLSTRASCEEVVQDTWLAVVRGVDRFEGRSSLRTWVFRILVNLAKTRGVREARTTPLSAWAPTAESGPVVDPERFAGPDHPRLAHWTPVAAPSAWPAGPEQAALAAETRRVVGSALRALPPRQQSVVTLRDLHGLSAEEVCSALNLSPGNERVLLHRGRARLRTALEGYGAPTVQWPVRNRRPGTKVSAGPTATGVDPEGTHPGAGVCSGRA